MTNETTIDPPAVPLLDAGPYPLDAAGRDELAKRFTYHPPKEGQPARYEFLRDHAHMLAVMISENVPPSRERSTALTHLETAVFWANAGIARNE